MKFYRITDRIPVEVGPLRFLVSPLTSSQKAEIADCYKNVSGEQTVDQMRVAFLTIKYSIKGLEGVNGESIEDAHGQPYELKFDASGCLADESVEEVMLLDQAPQMMMAAGLLAREIKEHKITGVKINLSDVRPLKKKEDQASSPS